MEIEKAHNIPHETVLTNNNKIKERNYSDIQQKSVQH